MNQLKQMLKSEYELQEKLIHQYEKEIKRLPQGSLSKKMRGRKPYYYYQYKEKNGKFVQRLIKKKENQLTEQLKRRRYLEEALAVMLKNTKLIRNFSEKYCEYCPESIAKILPDTYAEIPLSCYTDTRSKNVRLWLSQKHVDNSIFAENKIHQTIAGEFVRSKSEAIIAGLLTAEDIPYKYEAMLRLGDDKVSPDFTILRERDSEELYWEHFGLIDNPEYLQNAIKKILLYREHGITLGNRLIISFDNVDGGIDVKELQDTIRLKLL